MKRKLKDNIIEDDNNIEHDNIFRLLNIVYNELKSSPSKMFFNPEEWQKFYMDSNFYENIINNIEKGDFIIINNLEQNIWCEVINTHKNYKENQNSLIENKKLLVRIDNVISNKEYSFNTFVEIKIINIFDFCKKDELFYRYCKI